MALTPKQETFCQEYLLDLNATQAAIRAGYSVVSAASQGERLLRNDEVASRVRDLREVRAEKVGISSEWVLRAFIEVAQRCMQPKPLMIRQGREMVQATSEEGEGIWEFDSMGANSALTAVGKHLGFFEEHNKQKKADVPAVFQVVPASQRAAAQVDPEE